MKIAGLQKMTLLDYPGRVACTVFLPGCNFRCPFCHNSRLLGGDTQSLITEEELLAFLEKRRGLLDGVCVTGGEPTLSAGLDALLDKIKAMGYAVKLDTNGSHPEILEDLIRRGLVDYVAMDIKNSPDRYSLTCGCEAPGQEKIEESIRLLLEGSVDYELRTTVVEQLHDEDSIARMGQWLAGFGRAKRLYLQSFVDRDTVAVAGLSAPDVSKMEKFRDILLPFVDNVSIRGMG